MRRPVVIRAALRLLRQVSGGAYGEALCGDLLEELERTGSVSRFWREIAVAVLRGMWGRWLQPVMFSVGWSLCYPAWRAMDGGRMSTALAERGFAMAWPYSSVMLLASAGLSPLLFVWLGALLYLVRSQRGGGWAETMFRAVRGLSLGLSVLLVAAMVMLSGRDRAEVGNGGADGLAAELSQRVQPPAMTLSLTLSLLAATLSARVPRLRLPVR